MNKTYEALDCLILHRLKGETGLQRLFLNSQEVRWEAERLAVITGREAYRILDGRLQALRKGCKIAYNHAKKGWRLFN